VRKLAKNKNLQFSKNAIDQLSLPNNARKLLWM